MKARHLLVYSLPLYFATPALALDASSCAAKSARLRLSQRVDFMKSCLAQVSAPANVKQAELRHKKTLCEQNAKNYSLRGNERVKFIAACISENEAEAATKARRNHKKTSRQAVKPASAKGGA